MRSDDEQVNEIEELREQLAAANALPGRIWEALGELTSYVVDGDHMVKVDAVRSVFERHLASAQPAAPGIDKRTWHEMAKDAAEAKSPDFKAALAQARTAADYQAAIDREHALACEWKARYEAECVDLAVERTAREKVERERDAHREEMARRFDMVQRTESELAALRAEVDMQRRRADHHQGAAEILRAEVARLRAREYLASAQPAAPGSVLSDGTWIRTPEEEHGQPAAPATEECPSCNRELLTPTRTELARREKT